MGMSLDIDTTGKSISWENIQATLAALGKTPQMRLIDGMPAFPDELPEANWSDIRVSLGAGMISIKRVPGQVQVVVWGNADPNTLADQQTLAEAIRQSVT